MNGKSMFRRGLLVSTVLLACGIVMANQSHDTIVKASQSLDTERPTKESVKTDHRGAFINTTDLSTFPIVSPVTMAARIAGSLVVPGSETFNGLAAGPWGIATRAGGHFMEIAGPPPIGISSGTILSTGHIWTAEDGAPGGWNQRDWTSFWNFTPGDPDVSIITLRPTFDAAILEFDILSATERTIRFPYVFGSEEYNEWARSWYNDGFGIWITGPGPVTINVAQLFAPFTNVVVNNVNFWGMGFNTLLYANNDPAARPVDWIRQTELDGLVQFFGWWADKVPFFNPPAVGPPSTLPAIPIRSLPFTMAPGVTYHVKIAIADASDTALDSVVMLGSAYPGACWYCDGPDFICQDGIDPSNCTDTWASGFCIDVTPPCGGPTGACYSLLEETCTITTEDVCEDSNGVYAGDATTCSDPNGACCLDWLGDGGPCIVVFAGVCTEMGGTYQGDGTSCAPLGACVMPDGSCIETTEICCTGGSWASGPCAIIGACCAEDGSCSMMTEADCESSEGTYQGDGTVCDVGTCKAHIPTVSEWGLIVMTLLLLTAATVVFGRQRRPVAA